MNIVKVIDSVKPIKWLIGKWSSISAKGQYPTIPPFDYTEDIKFVFVGQPMLNYISETWLNNKPKHLECGFLRINPGTNKVSFLLAQNFGITSIEEGTVKNNNEMIIQSTHVNSISFAVEPFVKSVKRHYKMNGNKLELVVYLETSKTPLTEHLRAVYEKRE